MGTPKLVHSSVRSGALDKMKAVAEKSLRKRRVVSRAESRDQELTAKIAHIPPHPHDEQEDENGDGPSGPTPDRRILAENHERCDKHSQRVDDDVTGVGSRESGRHGHHRDANEIQDRMVSSAIAKASNDDAPSNDDE
jgi:hypothetical protein